MCSTTNIVQCHGGSTIRRACKITSMKIKTFANDMIQRENERQNELLEFNNKRLCIKNAQFKISGKDSNKPKFNSEGN
jgi:hypothetical protein